jgi:hypothetical protein
LSIRTPTVGFETGCLPAVQGLNPYNVYACGIDFLLRLNQPALQPYAEEYALLTEPAALKIGIHIRVGDNQLVRSLKQQGQVRPKSVNDRV